MRIQRIVVFSLLLWIPGIAQASERLTLQEAYERALKQEPSIRIKRAATQYSQAGVDQAKASMLPQVNLSENYLRTDDPVGVFSAKLEQGKFAQQDFDLNTLNNPEGINNWRTRFEVNAPLFRSGVDWANLRAAKENVKAQTYLEQFQKRQVKLKITQLYFQSVGLKKEQEILREGMQKVRSLQAGYQPAQAPTSSTILDLSTAQFLASQLEADLTRVGEERKETERNLNVLMGQDPESPLNLVDPLPPMGTFFSSSSETLPVREDLQAAVSQVNAAQANKDGARRRFGPDVDFFGAYNLYTGNFQDSNGSYEVGARLNWPIFDWKTHADLKKAKAELNQAQEVKRAQELKFKADLANSTARLQASRRQFELKKKTLQKAGEVLEGAWARYQEGVLSLSQVAEAIHNVTRARIALTEIHLENVKSQADYDFERGAF